MMKMRLRSNRIKIPAKVIHLVMTQYSLKAGISNFGKEGENAVMKEFNALYMMNTFIQEMKKINHITKEAGTMNHHVPKRKT